MTRPPLPAPPYRGGCLCGAVRYRYEARPLGLNACHCNDCKRLTGSDYVKMLLGERAHFVQEQGEIALFTKRADSGRDVNICRCAQCGTRLWHGPAASPEWVFICAGTLDDPDWVVPASHIWTERAAHGVVFAPDALCIEGQPADRRVLFAAFDKLYPK